MVDSQLKHDCVDFWREILVVAPDDGMCKATTPGIKQWRALQWRTRASLRLGASVELFHYDYVEICDLSLQKQISFSCNFANVIEIRFNYQIYVQYAEKAISKITLNFCWNLKQIWHSWHT